MKHLRLVLPLLVSSLLFGCHKKNASDQSSNSNVTSRPGAITSPNLNETAKKNADSAAANRSAGQPVGSDFGANNQNPTPPPIPPVNTDGLVTPEGAGMSVGTTSAGDDAGVTPAMNTDVDLGTNNGMPPSSNDSGTTMSGTTSGSDTMDESTTKQNSMQNGNETKSTNPAQKKSQRTQDRWY